MSKQIAPANALTIPDPATCAPNVWFIGNAGGAQIASEGTNVYVAWNESSGNNSEIFFVESHDNGENFDMPDKLGNGTFFAQVPHVSSSTS